MRRTGSQGQVVGSREESVDPQVPRGCAPYPCWRMETDTGQAMRQVSSGRECARLSSCCQGKARGAPVATTVTLDTNLLFEYWRDRPRKAVVKRLLRLADRNDIDLAITARVREDIPDKPLASRINALAKIGVRETGSVTRLNYWVLGRDQLGSDAFEDFGLELESVRQERDPAVPDWRDWDHLHAHMLQHRAVFLTWDRAVLRLGQTLQARFGIRVESPEDFVSSIARAREPT
jgi:hypothetical protein